MEKILISLLLFVFANQLFAQKFFIEGDLPLATDVHIYCGGDTIFMQVILQDSVREWGVLANEKITLSLVDSKNIVVLRKDFKSNELGYLADFIVLPKGLEGDFFLYKNHIPFSKKIKIQKNRPHDISLKYTVLSLSNDKKNLKIELFNHYGSVQDFQLSCIVYQVQENAEIYTYSKKNTQKIYVLKSALGTWRKEGKLYKKYKKQKGIILQAQNFNSSGEIYIPLSEYIKPKMNYLIIELVVFFADKIYHKDFFILKV